jgi:hypothetical protein
MNKNLELNNIDFCIIQSADDGCPKLMVFFCRRGANDVNEEIWHSKEYPHLKSLTEKFDFAEIDYGVFESKSATDNFNGLSEMLLSAGLNYSEELEQNVLDQLNGIIDNVLHDHEQQLPNYRLN